MTVTLIKESHRACIGNFTSTVMDDFHFAWLVPNLIIPILHYRLFSLGRSGLFAPVLIHLTFVGLILSRFAKDYILRSE